MPKKIYLAFDFGLKRIGVALGQQLTKTARPLETIAAKEGNPDWTKIQFLIKRWQPAGLIVGIPLNMDGSPQAITHKARTFGKELHERFSLPIYEMDERLTTKDAREQLFAKGGFKALQDGQVDQVAAQLILENWFREQPDNKTD